MKADKTFVDGEVALYMGAWIEITLAKKQLWERRVALYMGAWIEITR